MSSPTVLVAGIGGASLGTEIAKALRMASGYRLLGCDISPLAFGHYAGLFERTDLVDPSNYIESVINLCLEQRVDTIVPGGDKPMTLLAAASDRFKANGIGLAINDPNVVARCSDKLRCFTELASLGFAVPRTVHLTDDDAADDAPLPAIVKPSSDSGGSAFVFHAQTRDELRTYARYIRDNGRSPIAQEYVPIDGGEFTVGVLSDPSGVVAGAIALKRAFPSKLSVSAAGPTFLISSGVTQGHIDEYPAITQTCINIARALMSAGPLNVQGRVGANGAFLPFEINPRFSASTYLRALAGFNEIDYFVRALAGQERPLLSRRSGWYLRSLTEVFVDDAEIVS